MEKSDFPKRIVSWSYGRDFCKNAAKNGHLLALEWLRMSNSSEFFSNYSFEIPYIAIKNGHLNILIWWTKCNEFPSLDKKMSAYAAKSGCLKTLQWLRENRCPWDEKTCKCAAKEGHFEILKWARENNCPWDWKTTYYSKLYGHNDIYNWVVKNGCPEEPYNITPSGKPLYNEEEKEEEMDYDEIYA
jgi:hypothetical protein